MANNYPLQNGKRNEMVLGIGQVPELMNHVTHVCVSVFLPHISDMFHLSADSPFSTAPENLHIWKERHTLMECTFTSIWYQWWW